MNNKIFGYGRVSSIEQNLERQISMLKEYGVEESDMYLEKVSGVAARRPILEDLQKMLRAGDTVICESLSRLSRSTSDLLLLLNDWESRDITFISLKENLDFSTAAGKLMLTFFAAMSQFERDNLRERVAEGIAAARSKGRVGGRKPTSKQLRAKAIKLHHAGAHSIKEICEITGVSKSVLYRELSLLKKHEMIAADNPPKNRC
ncbi:recombinase family protein [Paenibacillus sp. FSL R7-269]|uniref:recombinase family protein n=1 Tax=Paenibacillus sp. FSL R7-269 TaxID=1226755 RepID=UPI0007C73C11|nr:recombinase family protein [Paenibacillus sp. FSL R7-269]